MKRISLSFILVFIFCLFSSFNFVSAAVSLDQTTSNALTGVSSLTLSHTVSGSDRLLFVTVGIGAQAAGSRNVTSVTSNGTPLTRTWTADEGVWEHSEGWYMVNPPTGTNTIVVTLAGSADQIGVGASSFTGVDGTTPLGTPATASSATGQPSLTVSSQSGELVIAGIGSDSEAGITEGGTLLWEKENVGADSSFGAQTYPGAASVLASWTQTSTRWAVGGVSLKPSNSTPPPGDTTPPSISSVTSTSLTSSGATVTWNTDESSDSQVEYGLTTGYGSSSSLNSSLTISHTTILTGLSPSTLYHYRVKSKDASGNLSTSGDATFTTTSAPAGGAINCDQTTLQSAINAAVSGSTITCNAGNWTWTTTQSVTPSVTINKSITLQGAGIGQTVISDGTTSGSDEVPLSINGAVRITGFTFADTNRPADYKEFIKAGGDNWRIDHNRFAGVTGVTAPIAAYGTGVIDQNTFDNTTHISAWGNGSSSWSQTQALATGNAIYVEGNTFNYSSFNDGALDGFDGARYVFRYNTINGTQFGHHGFDSGGLRSTLNFEVYNNLFTNPNGTIFAVMNFRGGTGVVFNNSVSASGGSYTDFIKLQNYRSGDNYTSADGNGTGSLCNGTAIGVDGNTAGGQGYPCKDQIGRTANQVLQPLYAWNNTFKGTVNYPMSVDNAYGGTRLSTFHVLKNRDYYEAIQMPGYTPYTCPNPITGLSAGCNSAVAGAGGYNSAPAGDTTAPTVPTSLSATAVSSTGINLTWTASTDAVGVTGYTIRRGGTVIGTSATNSYSDTGLSASTLYSYTVSASDAAGNNSTQSTSASATTQSSVSCVGPAQAAVQTAINNAANGATVTVCAGNATWTSAITVTGKRLTIVGAGAGSTSITLGVWPGLNLQVSSSHFVDISGFTFIGGDHQNDPMFSIGGDSTAVYGSDVGFRFHHSTWTQVHIGAWVDDLMYGLFDHLTVNAGTSNGQVVRITGGESAQSGATAWDVPLQLGTDKAVYIEDSTFTGVCDGAIDMYNGSRAVVRHNTLYRCGIGNHGTDTGGHRSGASMEGYANVISYITGVGENQIGNVRGGTALYFDNTQGVPGVTNGVSVQYWRAVSHYNQGTWASCNGTAYRIATDYGSTVTSGGLNAGTIDRDTWGTGAGFTGFFDGGGAGGYPCRDQPGYGPRQIQAPLYMWNNSAALGNFGINCTSDTDCNTVPDPMSFRVAQNRDYFNYVPSGFNGTVGVGRGSTASRPATCTTGVGYFDTTIGSLFTCATTNTWTKYYTPYVYPHPLASGIAPPPTDTTAPTTPTNLSATAVSSTGINLSWTASTDAVGVTGYTVRRTGTVIGTSATNSYSDSGLTASTLYSYTVSASDAAGNNSAQSTSASATTQAGAVSTLYYVTQSGAGSHAGTSLVNAWSVSEFNASSLPTGGNTVNFSGTITSTVTPNKSGTGNGTGRLTLDFSGATLNTADPRINLGAHNFLNVLGGTLGTATDGALITSNNAVIHDVTISNWTHTGAVTSTAGFVDNTFGSNLIISNNTLDNIRTLFLSFTTQTHDIVISNNYARTSLNTTDQTDLIFFGDVYNVTIEGNKLIQRTQGAASVRHNDIIQTFRSGSSLAGNPTNWVVRYNWLELAVTGGSGDNSWMMMENITGNPGLKIYSNVFVGTGTALPGGNGIVDQFDARSTYFYNNTVVRHQQPVNALRFLSPGTLYSRNNIGYSDSPCSCTMLQWTMGAGATWDRNFFYNFDVPNSTYPGPNGASQVNPLFVDPANNNFALQSASPLIGKGDTAIGAEYNQGIAPNATWPNPTLVARSSWDVGAYVFTGVSSDTTAPSVPSNLSATAISSSGVNLTWTASTDSVGVTGYKVFRAGTQIGTSGTNSYSDTGLTPSTLYSYTVSANDAAGNNSAQSSSASATTQSTGVSTKFTIGQRVQTTANVNVRATANTTGTLLGTQTTGSLGTITSNSTPQGGFNWWSVNYDSGADGFSAEDFLVVYVAQTPTTHYVNNSGSPVCSNSGSGTLANPWCTVQYGVQNINSGDTLYVRSGTYNESFTITGPSGTASAHTIISAYPGETPILRGTGFSSGRMKITGACSYIDFIGFEITNYNQGLYLDDDAGTNVACTNLLISGLHVHDVGQEGIAVRAGAAGTAPRNFVIQNSEIDHTGRLGTSNGEGLYIGNSSGTDTTNGVTVRNNKIHDAQDECIELKGDSHDNIIEFNDIYNCLSPGSSFGNTGGAIEIDEPRNTNTNPNQIIRGNTIHDIAFTSGITKRGIRAGTGATIYNNILYNISSSYSCILSNTSNFTRLMYHNTIDCTTANAVVNSGTTIDSRNNIGPTGTNNLAFNSAYVVNAASRNYHLVSGSSPVNAGANLTATVSSDIEGNSRSASLPPDIGAYEFTGSSPAGLSGDINLDHIVNSLDWSLMSSVWLTSNATSDLNHDGIVNSLDFSTLSSQWLQSW